MIGTVQATCGKSAAKSWSHYHSDMLLKQSGRSLQQCEPYKAAAGSFLFFSLVRPHAVGVGLSVLVNSVFITGDKLHHQPFCVIQHIRYIEHPSISCCCLARKEQSCKLGD